MEINPSTGSLTKTYIYANSEILAQHDGDTSDDRYFYLHDRLGSVRLVIDHYGGVQNYYTYEPFGQTIESGGTLDNAFRFTGQYFDAEIQEYYLRARQYNPYLSRFTSRDPIRGRFQEPLTLHKFIYCLNDPVSNVDPTGKEATKEEVLETTAIGAAIDAGTTTVILGLAYWATQQLVENILDYNIALSMATVSDRFLDQMLVHFSWKGKDGIFKGGSQNQRDNWGGLENKPDFKNFERWFHRKIKPTLHGFMPDPEELQYLYDEFMDIWNNKEW